LARIAVGFALVCFADAPLADQVTVSELLNSCSKKTEVWEKVDGKLERVGQRLDSFCEGFLLGAFSTLLLEGKVCVGEHSTRPEYLESVFRLSVSRSAGRSGNEAAPQLKEAFSRAFPCKR
jgi:hypothetical protein